jgi:small subunit ribosomal protein S24e
LDLKILEERPNPLLKRVEYRFEVGHAEAATPTRDDVRSELAKAAKVPKERLVIERMRALYGIARTRGEAVAYETVEARDVAEREHILVRNGLKEKPAAAPAPTGGAPAAPPAAAPAASPTPSASGPES